MVVVIIVTESLIKDGGDGRGGDYLIKDGRTQQKQKIGRREVDGI